MPEQLRLVVSPDGRRTRYDAFGREIRPRGTRRDPLGRDNPSWPHGYR